MGTVEGNQAYPLAWPPNWDRCRPSERVHGKFSKSVSGQYGRTSRELTYHDGFERGLFQLRLLGVDRDSIIVSTNLRVRNDGLPYADQRQPEDPGAAVYWQRRGHTQQCMAIDKYTRVADNLAAIAATLEDLRSIELHGGAKILERAFSGFTSLPAVGGTGIETRWWVILGVSQESTPFEIQSAYRGLAKRLHPDTGGAEADAEKFAQVSGAWAQVRKLGLA